MKNRLSTIYTGAGDDGTTRLANGKCVDKSSLRIRMMGEIDELNSLLGVLEASGTPSEVSNYIHDIQQRLFDIGGEIALPGHSVIKPNSVKWIERLIDSYNENLLDLKEFILPGGTMSASICHLSRSICRRCEQSLVRLGQVEYINPETLRYLNRLSDLLFVLARTLNQLQGNKEVFWNSERLKRFS